MRLDLLAEIAQLCFILFQLLLVNLDLHIFELVHHMVKFCLNFLEFQAGARRILKPVLNISRGDFLNSLGQFFYRGEYPVGNTEDYADYQKQGQDGNCGKAAGIPVGGKPKFSCPKDSGNVHAWMKRLAGDKKLPILFHSSAKIFPGDDGYAILGSEHVSGKVCEKISGGICRCCTFILTDIGKERIIGNPGTKTVAVSFIKPVQIIAVGGGNGVPKLGRGSRT